MSNTTNPVNNEAQVVIISNEKNVVANFNLVNGIWMISSVEVARIFERNHGDLTKVMKRDHKVQMDKLIRLRQMEESNYTNSGNKTYDCYLLSITALEYFVSNMRKSTMYKDDMLTAIHKLQGHKTVFTAISRAETSFKSDLKQMLGCMQVECVFEYVVSPYRIDIYIPKYKLYVEYDEAFHTSQTDKDIKREKYIMDKLGGEFIRCDFKDSNAANMGKVANRIINLALHG